MAILNRGRIMSVIISAVLPPFPKGIFSHERQRHDFPGVPLKSSLFNEFRAGSVCPLGIWVCIWGHPASAQVQGDRRKFLIPTVKISLRAILLPYYLIYDRWWTGLFCSACAAVKYDPCPRFEVKVKVKVEKLWKYRERAGESFVSPSALSPGR